MANWTDPDLRNHVNDDSGLRIDNFQEAFAFQNNIPNGNIYPYKLKDVYVNKSIIYKALNNDKFDKYNNWLRENSSSYQFLATSNSLPMSDAYSTFGKMVYLYQLLLSVNGLWNIMEYNDSTVSNGRIYMPSSNQLTNILRDLLKENSSHNMREITNLEELRETLKMVISDAQIDYNLTDVITEKMRMKYSQTFRRLTSPLILKYLNTQLNKLINNIDDTDNNLLVDKLNELFRELNIYITETNNED